ncbi:hypothetical protein EDD22DRAFT_850611 [Suillus occidentalis]|nr:hypothetical protein EDD22DRAFT_850611 [Suillus occidentalis]
MDLPEIAQFFLQLPSESKIDGYLHDETDIGCSSPHLTPSDNIMLDPNFWTTNNPACHLLKQHILQVTQPKPKLLATQMEALRDTDWIDDLFLIKLESDKPLTTATLPSKAIPIDDSITEPESDEPVTTALLPSRAIPIDNSITEPESDEPVTTAPLPSTFLPIDDSITESESEPNNAPIALSTPKPTITKLHKKWFATLSPPAPDSIYWRYFTREEEAQFYDRSGTDKSFQTVRKLRQELQGSLDTELEK